SRLDLQQTVLLGASAPRAAQADSEFTVRFVAYMEAEEAAVLEMLEGLSPSAIPHLGVKRCRWRRGTEVVVALTARGLTISPSRQVFTWEAERVLLEFDVVVPKDAKPGVIAMKFDVLIDDVVVAMLRFDLR